MEVLVVSKSFIVREALGTFFGSKFENYEFKGLRELDEIKCVNLSKVKFILIDIESDIIDEIFTIKESFKNIKVVIFDRNNNNDIFLKSIKSSIDGYLENIPEKEDLVYIVRKILSGKKYYDTDLIDNIILNQQIGNPDNLNMLTSRECEVLELVVKGLSNKEIAQRLYITEHTIKKHITSILSKLNMKNRKDLIIYTRDKFNNNMKYA